MIGSRLAHYEITTHLGTGGMGEVWQATDSKLGRSVAIKFLPDAFARDVERVARFEREARVLASLNHPHIAAIYGLEDSGGRNFLVMELAEGESLAARIARGPVPMDEALAIAVQIAEALEAAHEKGVMHRDLKPANIKVRADGQVKVLDFGLAKAFAGETANANLSNSPTLSLAATNAGVIFGTAAYMSPEQAKGLTLDRRTDVFSFGVVLYEMLTGRQLFHGDTVAETLARVIEREPDWSRLPKNTPAPIQKLLERCLRKDRTRRLQTAGDARIEIEDARSDRGVWAVQDGPGSTVQTSRGANYLYKGISVVLLIAVAALAFLHFGEAPSAETPETRLEIVTPATPDPISFAISPDGRQIVFVASGDGRPQLWLRPLDAVTAQPLAGTEAATFPFWSPDSRSIGFFAGGRLKRMDIGGGLPQVLADAPGFGGTWGPEGVILFSGTQAGAILRIPASGGEVMPVTKVDSPAQVGHRFPQFLPGGRQFLFYVTGSLDVQGIYLGSLDAPETKRLAAADTAGLYAAPGWLLFIRQGTLVARLFDLSRGDLTGDPITVADPVGVSSNPQFAGAFSVSAGGAITYRAGVASRRQLTWFDRSGKVLGTVGPPDENALLDPAISPDGRRVAVDRTVQGNRDIWLLDGTRTTRFTFDAAPDTFPIWSRDGTRIVFGSPRKGAVHMYQKPSNGAGAEELLYESPIEPANSWSPDGRFLLYLINDPKTSWDIWVMPLEGDRKPRVFLNTPFDERNSQFSPDGRWVAYRSNESGQTEIYVRPFPGPGGQWQVSTGGGTSPRWRPDGKELYYIAPDNRLMAVPITTRGTTLEPGTPVPLFQTRIVFGGANLNRQQYDVAPDGRFLINVDTEDAVVSPITMIQNWKPPVK